MRVPGSGSAKGAAPAISSPPRTPCATGRSRPGRSWSGRSASSGTSEHGTRRRPRRARPLPAPPGERGRAWRAAARRRGRPRCARSSASPARIVWLAEPRDLLHGRERIPGGGRAVVSRRGAGRSSDLAPEERGRAARAAAAARYGARATRPLRSPLDDASARSRGGCRVLRVACDELVFSVDAPVDGRGRAARGRAGGRVGPIAALGGVAREDPLVTIPELDEDGLDRRRLAKDAPRDVRAATGWLSPSVRTTTSRFARLRREVALAANRRQRVRASSRP